MKLASLLPFVGAAYALVADPPKPLEHELVPTFTCTHWQDKYKNEQFRLEGENFPEKTLGRWGRGVLDNLRVCGEVKDWEFDGTPMKWQISGWYRHKVRPTWCLTGAMLAVGGQQAFGECVEAHTSKRDESTYTTMEIPDQMRY